MDNAVRNVRSYVKRTIVQVPETADYITRFLPSAPNSLLLSSQDQLPESSPTTLLSPLLDPPSQDHHDDLHNPDPSNNHLVSGSDYDIYISEDGLTHRGWYEQENELENSSDEEEGAQDFDHSLFSEGEIGEDPYLYDSD
jgi:hypothetical protein